MGRQDKHENGNEDGGSGVADVGQVAAVGDPLEQVAPAENENGLSEKPEENEDPEAGQDGPLMAARRSHAVVMLVHGLSDLTVPLN